ncbi:hypothetical protein [Acinetobacter oleivorans]|jgi:hypothetical protein|uniref:Uncharacterized protein n=1 Tax=Acinetobacter oleivorans (strain JCM 16667 / KCTC 23045 / DR1) TaxID=436717 RepID=A0AAN0UEY7_ACISD|nr:hypothetical protein [Acinetobacter oleivorans]ADI92670.1 hypothetical protein AOLE_18940 [Acinetobacter oleivorans DR1]ESK43894.1 hypothetical protein P254_03044 [Acinetobacter oleivorans CIP 110421]MBJ9421759.1 hypothetical protein [Acinetobacter oleivorans]WQF72857.1 hypothetical protein OKW95_18930 [Acinetobacter oleivorans]
MFRYILLGLILSGCSNYDAQPKELAVAYVNKSYSQNIKITGGKVSEQHFELTSNIPENQEIKITPVDDIDGYNHLRIDGIPKYKGKYEIIINAHFYGRGDDKLNKTYEFVVKE